MGDTKICFGDTLHGATSSIQICQGDALKK